MRTHSVKYNLIMNTILRMSSFLFPLITFPYVSRILGVELYGKIAFASSYVTYYTMFAQLGIPTYGIRACAKVRDNREQLSETVAELLLINSVMVVISYAALLISVFTIPRIIEDSNVILISSVTVILTCLGMDWLYQALEQYDYITVRNIALKFFSVILMFLLVHKPEHYIVYAGINVTASVGSNVLNFIRSRHYVILRLPKPENVKRHIRPILVFFLFTVSATIYTSLDSVMLGFMSTDKQVGLYAASIKMRNILYSLVTSIGTVLLPRASYLIQKKEFEKFENIIQKSFQFIAVTSIPLTIFFVIEAQNSIVFLSGNGYIEAAAAMMIVMPTIIAAGISNVTGIQILIPLGYEKYTIASTFGGAVTDLTLNAVLIPKYGAAGAAAGTLAAEIMVMLIQLIFMKRLQLMNYLNIDRKNLFKISMAAFISGVALLSVQTIICDAAVFVKLVIGTLVFFAIYTGILAGTKEFIFRTYGLETIKGLVSKISRQNSGGK